MALIYWSVHSVTDRHSSWQMTDHIVLLQFTSLSAVNVKTGEMSLNTVIIREPHGLLLRFDWHLWEREKKSFHEGNCIRHHYQQPSRECTCVYESLCMCCIRQTLTCQGFGLIGWNLTSCATSSMHIPSSFFIIPANFMEIMHLWSWL